MTATINASSAVLKTLYPGGTPPSSVNEQFKFFKSLGKYTEFGGDGTMNVPLQHTNPGGSGPTMSIAQGSLAQSMYKKFVITRQSHYAVARITGEALEAAKPGTMAFLDLWKHETECAARTLMRKLESQLFLSGVGVLSQISSGVATATITLPTTANMNYFDINDRLVFVSDATSSPTLRAGTATVTGVDRRNRTLTFASALNTLVAGVVDGDYICQVGENSVSGSGVVVMGLDGYVEGGSSPSTIFSLTRTADPVRLAGQAIDYTNVPPEVAIADASAQAGYQGTGAPKTLVANNIEVSTLKKSMSGKIIYDRNASNVAKGSFGKVMIDGDDGDPIEVIASPYAPRFKAYLIDKSAFDLVSLGAAPHKDTADGKEFSRLETEDAYEVRWKFYGNLRCKNPAPHVRLLNFCV